MRRGQRIADALLGALLVGVAVAAALASTAGAGPCRLVAALATGAPGVDALVAAARGTRSLVSRVGPLP